jgi:hypothetical protein
MRATRLAPRRQSPGAQRSRGAAEQQWAQELAGVRATRLRHVLRRPDRHHAATVVATFRRMGTLVAVIANSSRCAPCATNVPVSCLACSAPPPEVGRGGGVSASPRCCGRQQRGHRGVSPAALAALRAGNRPCDRCARGRRNAAAAIHHAQARSAAATRPGLRSPSLAVAGIWVSWTPAGRPSRWWTVPRADRR